MYIRMIILNLNFENDNYLTGGNLKNKVAALIFSLKTTKHYEETNAVEWLSTMKLLLWSGISGLEINLL